MSDSHIDNPCHYCGEPCPLIPALSQDGHPLCHEDCDGGMIGASEPDQDLPIYGDLGSAE